MSNRQMLLLVRTFHAIVLMLLLALAGCQAAELPTRMPVATVDEVDAQSAAEAVVNMPPTWTPLPTFVEVTATPLPTEPPPATSTPIPTAVPPSPTSTPLPSPLPSATLPPTNTPLLPTSTAILTSTPVPPATDTPLPLEPSATSPPPTDTPIPPPPALPTDTPIPPPPPQPDFGPNLLPNPSFEEGHYNSGGVGELQVPNGWTFEWSGGTNPFVSPPDDYFVRPETRVLPAYQLPPHEQPLFIWDGQFTMKIFKGYWAIDVQLVTDLFLDPGTYLFEINVFPDLVVGYDNGQKVYAPDPYSGEVRFVVSGGGTGWFPPVFGQRNALNHTFVVSQAQTIRVGAGLRNRYGIMNNGWFVDHWSLRKVNNP